jgi:predicted amidohydrolase
MENRIFFVESSRVGKQEKIEFSGRSCITGPNGEVLACSEGEEEEIVRASLCADEFYEARAMYPDFRDRRPEHYGLLAELN